MCVAGGVFGGLPLVDPVKQEALRLAVAWGTESSDNTVVEAAALFEKFLRGKTEA